MKKILSLGFFALLLSTGVAFADSSVNYPSTFSLRVGEKVNIANYQNMQIHFLSVGTDNGDCKTSTTPCPLGNPVNSAYPSTGAKSVTIVVSTAGGCAPGADERCMGGPAFQNTFTLTKGGSANALAVKIEVTNIAEGSATFRVSLPEDGGDRDDTVVSPLPPPVLPVIKVTSVSSGQGTIRQVEKIIVCPNGEASENCSVCERGECKPETTPATPRKLGEPISSTNPPVMNLKSDETLVSAVRVDSSGTSTTNVYEVKAKRNARILFLFPVNPEITYTVSATGSSTVSAKPWWNFLAW